MVEELMPTKQRPNLLKHSYTKRNCQNSNSTKTQPQPNITLVGLDMEITLHCTTPPRSHQL